MLHPQILAHSSSSAVPSHTNRRKDQCCPKGDRQAEESTSLIALRLLVDLVLTYCHQAKENADHLLQEKADLEKEKKKVEDEAGEKEKARDRKCKTIGNYVHESVPVNDNEVRRTQCVHETRR